MPFSATDKRYATRNGRRLRRLVRRIRMVGLAGLELVRTLLGIDYIVRMLRILLAILRHVGTMDVFFTHYSFTTVNRSSRFARGLVKLQHRRPPLLPWPRRSSPHLQTALSCHRRPRRSSEIE